MISGGIVDKCQILSSHVMWFYAAAGANLSRLAVSKYEIPGAMLCSVVQSMMLILFRLHSLYFISLFIIFLLRLKFTYELNFLAAQNIVENSQLITEVLNLAVGRLQPW